MWEHCQCHGYFTLCWWAVVQCKLLQQKVCYRFHRKGKILYKHVQQIWNILQRVTLQEGALHQILYRVEEGTPGYLLIQRTEQCQQQSPRAKWNIFHQHIAHWCLSLCLASAPCCPTPKTVANRVWFDHETVPDHEEDAKNRRFGSSTQDGHHIVFGVVTSLGKTSCQCGGQVAKPVEEFVSPWNINKLKCVVQQKWPAVCCWFHWKKSCPPEMWRSLELCQGCELSVLVHLLEGKGDGGSGYVDIHRHGQIALEEEQFVTVPSPDGKGGS